ncbi:MAG: FAD-dependent oxidoreductase [Candidatus Hadarchaeales archaeon]
MEEWDLIVVGGGPAGLTAGIYGVRGGLRTLVLEGKGVGGRMLEAPLIENYPGVPPMPGAELASRMAEHCRRQGAEVREGEEVKELLVGEKRGAVTEKGEYRAGALVLAMGVRHRTLGVPGEKEFAGKGVSYCPVCDGPLFRRKRVVVVGGGNSAVSTALYLSGLASEVTLVHRRGELRADPVLAGKLEGKVRILWNRVVEEIAGEGRVRKVRLREVRTGEREEVETDGVFVTVGEEPNSELAKRAGIRTDEGGYIVVDRRQRTSAEGVYAAGDVTDFPVKQVTAAVAQGMVAALEARSFLKG